MHRAVELGTRQGLRISSPRILSDRSNLVLHLAPTPVVARVATATAELRGEAAAFEAMDRSVRVARWMGDLGAPVAKPSAEVPPGPHRHDGLLVTFFEYLDHHPERPLNPVVAAGTLHEVHAALRELDLPLPPLTPIVELRGVARQLVDHVRMSEADAAVVADWLDVLEQAVAARGLPERPLHGDATVGNVLRTPSGPVWNDFEDACTGPVEWDLACCIAPVRVFGLHREDAEHTLAAYGEPDPEMLHPFVVARAVQSVLWRAHSGRVDLDAMRIVHRAMEALI